MSVTPRAVVSLELPTPLQQVKLDSLEARLRRNGRTIDYIPDDRFLPEAYHRDDAFIIWVVIYKGYPEGVIYIERDGIGIRSYAHKGLFDLIIENAQAGGWRSKEPVSYYDGVNLLGGEIDRREADALAREYGWID